MSNNTFHVIFCGTPAFAVPSLRALCTDARFSVDLVITQPDRPVGRDKIITAPPVKSVAAELGIPVYQPENLSREWDEYGKGNSFAAPDFLVVVAYGQILKPNILALPRIAPVNLHASLLPKLRGASPIQHAILQGERETGVTVQRMVEKLDAGPILAQARMPIDDATTYVGLSDALARMGAELLAKTLGAPLTETPQEESEATVCRKLTRADGLVYPATMTAEEIDRRVRALTPWPGVTWDDVKILETSLAASPESFSLGCAQATTLYLKTVQPSGGKPMTGASYMRGRKPDRLS